MADARDIQRALDARLSQYEPAKIYGSGPVVARAGNVWVSQIANHVWVAVNGEDTEPVAALVRERELQEQMLAGLHVVVGFRQHSTDLEVLWLDTDNISGYLDLLDWQEQLKQEWVYFRRIADGLHLYPNGDLTVRISPLAYKDPHGQQVVFAGTNSYDLAASVPGSGGRYTLVYLDAATNTLAVEGGTTTPAVITPARPTVPQWAIGSAWVRLVAGQTAIAEDDIIDARPFLSIDPGTAVLQLPKTIEAGWSLNVLDGHVGWLAPDVAVEGDITVGANSDLTTMPL